MGPEKHKIIGVYSGAYRLHYPVLGGSVAASIEAAFVHHMMTLSLGTSSSTSKLRPSSIAT